MASTVRLKIQSTLEKCMHKWKIQTSILLEFNQKMFSLSIKNKSSRYIHVLDRQPLWMFCHLNPALPQGGFKPILPPPWHGIHGLLHVLKVWQQAVVAGLVFLSYDCKSNLWDLWIKLCILPNSWTHALHSFLFFFMLKFLCKYSYWYSINEVSLMRTCSLGIYQF